MLKIQQRRNPGNTIQQSILFTCVLGVCVCQCERERESECTCVYVCACVYEVGNTGNLD